MNQTGSRWCVYGSRCSSTQESYSFHVFECCDEQLYEAVKTFYAVEETSSVDSLMAKEDERALAIMESTIRRIRNWNETDLIRHEDEVKFLNSYYMAVRC